MCCAWLKKKREHVPLFASDRGTRFEQLWQRTFLIPDVCHPWVITLDIREMESDLHLVHFRFLERGSGADKQQTSWKDRSGARIFLRIVASFTKILVQNTWIFADCQASTGVRISGSRSLAGQIMVKTTSFHQCFGRHRFSKSS